jgi:type I restriction enzyme S subunit
MSPESEQRRDLPRDWRWVRLGDIITEGPTNGHSPRSNPGAAGTLTLRLSATTPGHLVLNDATTKRLDEQVPTESPLWLRPGDLLVQRSNTAELVGTAAIYDGPPATYVYPDLLMRLRFDEPATARWVWRFLNSPTGRRQLQQLAGGSAGNMPKISGAKLVSVPIPVPPLPEQRRIAALLDKADAIRRKRQQAIRLADDLLRSAFLDMFGDPVTNPKGWPVATFASLVDRDLTRNGLSPSSEGTHPSSVLTLTAITRARFDAAQQKRALFDCAPPAEKFVDHRDFLVCRGNGNLSMVGVGRFPPSDLPGVLFPDTMIAMRVDESRVCRDFLETLWQTPFVRRQIETGARTTSGTYKINQRVLDAVRLPIPAINLQHRFSALAGVVARLHAAHAGPEPGDLLGVLVQRAFRGDP